MESGSVKLNRLLGKSFFSGCSKMSILRSSATAQDGTGCKVHAVCDTCLQAIMRNEAYMFVRRSDE